MMILKRTDSSHKDFQDLVKLLDADLAVRNGEDQAFFDQFNKLDTIKNCIVVYINEVPAACGAIKKFDEETVEIKRMYTHPNFRKKGLATAIVKELEKWAKELNYKKAVLETSLEQNEALSVYEKSGYERIPNYGQYIGIEKSVCYEKFLFE
ncbi:GNAT family N-acetyltransferase [Flavobacterium sp. B17]|uniref:GNAT family N-acetyltransferase n=1 Tax=Flavobacterium sp. B17 TaxID=95618 RepID=UPI000347D169|nr:GNAT family N-acetyltransferase [Flavobacterium sp. B17]